MAGYCRELFPRSNKVRSPKKRKAGTPIGYINAEDILPRELIDRIREYIEGEAIYIPRTGEKRVAWGERNGTRNEYDRRNRAIISEYKSGRSVAELAESYALCEDSIRKILRGGRLRSPEATGNHRGG